MRGPSAETPASTASTGASNVGVQGVPPGANANASNEKTAVDNEVMIHYALEMLQGKKRGELPAGVDFGKREMYLEDKVFEDLFGMTKAKFSKLPSWRRKQKKQALKLF